MLAKTLSDTELLAILESQRRTALGYEDSELSADRREALDYYYGRPYGIEVEGRSQVVTKEVADTVDWMLSGLLRMFLQSGSVVEFVPVGEEDEEGARQETDFVNHVIMVQNNGALVLHDWFKDALLLKNGYVKHYWCEEDYPKFESYKGLLGEQVVELLTAYEMGGVKVEVIEQSEEEGLGLQGEPVSLINLKLRIVETRGRVKIEAVPAEEVRISRNCRGSLQDADFVEHRRLLSRSALIRMGMSRQFVEDLPAFEEEDNGEEAYARDTVGERSGYSDGGADRSSDLVEYCEAFVRVDYDKDGVAELRRVVTAGNKIPPGDDWNTEIDLVPMSYVTPNRIPHRHIGQGVWDAVKDIQLLKSTLTRLYMDGLYQTVAPETVVNINHVGDFLSDWMVTRPGGLKRTAGPIADSYAPYMKAPVTGDVLPALGYLDTVAERRTGVGPNSMGLDADTLKQTTANAAEQALRQANQRLELVARLFAEGVKDMVRCVHALLIKHSTAAQKVKMRGKYVSVDPREWRDRDDLVVNVGLGTGSGDEKIGKVQMLAQFQMMAAQAGLVGPLQTFNAVSEGIQALGFDTPERFIVNPSTPEYQQAMAQQQPPPNPLAEVEQVKGQFRLQEVQLKEQAAAAREAQRIQLEAQAQAEEAARRERVEHMGHQIAVAEGQSREQLEREKMALQRQLASEQAALNRYEADLKARVDIATAEAANQTRLAIAELQGQIKAVEMRMDARAADIARQLDVAKFAAGQRTEQRAQDINLSVALNRDGQPRKKRMSVLRGADGSMTGAEIEEQDD